MSNQKYGEMPWNDGSLGSGNKGGGGKDSFLKLKPGSNLIRVLTNPYQYYQHKYRFDINDKKDYGQRIPCSAQHGSCVVCAKQDKPKKRWYLGVIDRSTGTYKVLDVSWSVLSDIQTYAADPDWGPTDQYDFDIVCNPHAAPQDYYKAVAKPKRPLSAQDLLLKEKIDVEYLEKKCAPPEPSIVEEKYKMLEDKYLASKQSSSQNNGELVAFASKEEDDDDGFKNADAVGAPF